jgi:hypothetical protein
LPKAKATTPSWRNPRCFLFSFPSRLLLLPLHEGGIALPHDELPDVYPRYLPVE